MSACDIPIPFIILLDEITKPSVSNLQSASIFGHSHAMYDHRNFSFNDVHVLGSRRIARIAQSAGVSRFIHVSHLNASPDSPSAFYRSKYEAELAVRESFPESTIVRPGWLYGPEDRLLNTIAVSPSVYRVNEGDTRIRPVHVSCFLSSFLVH
jgi:uncharacterized protein YbjT (DUF2867 family)